jgi:1-acyl-sn-glycerol-3-phosphate acyltransferase
MQRFGLLLYTLWAAFWFVFLFLVLFPITFVCLQKESWKPGAHGVNRLWGHLFFTVIGMPVRIRYEAPTNPHQTYVFCANHFSYLDIAVMMLAVPNYFAFMGKSDVKTIPLFGYMFTKLHIQVDRNSAGSRTKALQRSFRALRGGRSIVIFPEGGIKSTAIPQMHHPFKDGAFRMAIQEKVPVVPISLINNYQRLPDEPKPRFRPGPIHIVVHRPVETYSTPLDEAHVDLLKEQVFQTIAQTLAHYHQTPPSAASGFERVTII